MKTTIRLGIGAALLLMTSVGTHAQRGAAHFVPPRPVVARLVVPRPAPPHRMVPVMHQASGVVQTNGSGTTATTFTNGSSTFTVLSGSGLPLDQLLNPVPGFGFDFTHLAAINRDLGIRALIDPITQQELALAERLEREFPTPVFFPAFFGGFGSEPVVAEQPPQQQQPPIIILQQPAPTAAALAGVVQQPVVQAPQPEAPLPDAGEFILVKRDGAEISVVAFARQGDRIAYITRDGNRRFLPLSDLNSDATKIVNEDRGTSLQFPL
jgi:hypothetical protein